MRSEEDRGRKRGVRKADTKERGRLRKTEEE